MSAAKAACGRIEFRRGTILRQHGSLSHQRGRIESPGRSASSEDAKKWRGPYIKQLRNDPWGNPLSIPLSRECITRPASIFGRAARADKTAVKATRQTSEIGNMNLTLSSGDERNIRACKKAAGIQRTASAGLGQKTLDFRKVRQSFSLSPGDLSRLGSGERNPAEGGGPRGPSERERASHWAGVKASVNRQRAIGAFTLVELVIVIVLIGIVSALIIPEMKSGYQDALLRSTSRNLMNAFSIASSRAVSLNQLHRVQIDANTGRYIIEKRIRETAQGEEFAPLKDVSEAEGTLDRAFPSTCSSPKHCPRKARRLQPSPTDNRSTRLLFIPTAPPTRWKCCCATGRDFDSSCALIPQRRGSRFLI